MSEPDAVPLPREGEVFFDVRGEARSMRLSWYANSQVAVFSIWQGNRCTGTFRLPFADLTRMVQALQAGPPSPVPAEPPVASGYQEPGYGQDHDFPATSSYGQPMPSDPGYASTATYYSGQEFAGAENAGPDYAGQEYAGQEYAGQEYAGQEYAGQEYAGQEPARGYAGQEPARGYAGQEYSGAGYQGPDYQEPEYQGVEYPYGDHPYGHESAEPAQAYGHEATAADQAYGQHGYSGDYSADQSFGRVGRHGAPRSDSPEPTRANYPMPDYDPPAYDQSSDQSGRQNYGDDYAASPHSRRTQPDLVRSQRAWSDSGWLEGPAQPGPVQPGPVRAEPAQPEPAQPEPARAEPTQEEPAQSQPARFESAQPDPLRSRDAESVPDPAMMSFPSVPARNGPSGYR